MFPSVIGGLGYCFAFITAPRFRRSPQCGRRRRSLHFRKLAGLVEARTLVDEIARPVALSASSVNPQLCGISGRSFQFGRTSTRLPPHLLLQQGLYLM
jgi:hypothetical protein